MQGPYKVPFRGEGSRRRMLRRATADITLKHVPVKRSYGSMLSPEQMNIAIQRESARADRSSSEFAMVLFRVRHKQRHALSTLRLAKLILRRVRTTDDVGWFNDLHICALLPDTSASGAWRFADDVCNLVAEHGPRPLCSVYSYPTKWLETAEIAGGTPAGRLGHSGNNGHGGNGHSGNGHNGHNGTNGNRAARSGIQVNDLMPYFMEGVSTGIGEDRPATQRLESLLVRPMPLWKRTIDILGAIIGIILLSPFMIFAAVGIKLTSRGPVVFKQKRAGLGGRPFTIYKFRTMCVDAEAKRKELAKLSEQDGPAFKLKNDPRVFKFGSFLRKTSIDEMLQLFNVLKGDMTLVGPRPLPVGEAAACDQWQKRRLDVTPGLTCIWQVRGRSTVSFAEWVRMDVAYMRRRTIWHDIRLIAATLPAVLLRRGAK